MPACALGSVLVVVLVVVLCEAVPVWSLCGSAPVEAGGFVVVLVVLLLELLPFTAPPVLAGVGGWLFRSIMPLFGFAEPLVEFVPVLVLLLWLLTSLFGSVLWFDEGVVVLPVVPCDEVVVWSGVAVEVVEPLVVELGDVVCELVLVCGVAIVPLLWS